MPTAIPASSRTMKTVESAPAICSTVSWNWNSGGERGRRCAFNAATIARTSSFKGVSGPIVKAMAATYSTTFGTMKK